MKCPQCSSESCGPYRCRFSGMTHELFRANNYANATVKGDLAARHQGRPDHDMSPSGMPWKPGT